jgi:DNA-binding CsgD family transcriptional regulator
MDHVSALAMSTALQIAKAGQLPLDELLVGLPFDAQSIRRMKRVRWDDYAIFRERMESACGGPRNLESLSARFVRGALPAELQAFLRAFVSPKRLFQFQLGIAAALFPNVDFEHVTLRDGRIRISARLHPYARPCAAFFRASVGGVRGTPTHIGLPMADVELDELTGRSLICRVRPPAPRTLLARARRASSRGFEKAAFRLVGHLSAQARATARARGGRADDMQRRFQLTSRQTDVLARIAQGLTNKEIADALDCAENTVEYHVTQLLRKTGVHSRSRLIATFWGSPQ